MSVNSRLKAIWIIGRRKAFYRQKIPEYSCARKETVDIDILVTHYSLCFFTGRWWTKRDGEEIIIFSNKIRIFGESPCFLSEPKSKYEGKTVFLQTIVAKTGLEIIAFAIFCFMWISFQKSQKK